MLYDHNVNAGGGHAHLLKLRPGWIGPRLK
jgi:hypothetical protein